jgi:hypothetical protein
MATNHQEDEMTTFEVTWKQFKGFYVTDTTTGAIHGPWLAYEDAKDAADSLNELSATRHI